MQIITAIILSSFAGYAGASYFNAIDGNLPALLIIGMVISSIYWLADRFYFLPQRRQAATLANSDESSHRKRLQQPWWLYWTAGLFRSLVVFAAILLFKFSFFDIANARSVSMMPTLLDGDTILVNKFNYGIRLPFLNTKITNGNKAERGDLVLFSSPIESSRNLAKRVIGVPGDRVAYLNRRLVINDQPVKTSTMPDFYDAFFHKDYVSQHEEILGEINYMVLTDIRMPATRIPFGSQAPSHEKSCQYNAQGVICQVPDGHYFVMGDHREFSFDSRHFGLVPESHLLGKVAAVLSL